jgi:hypothetical protein
METKPLKIMSSNFLTRFVLLATILALLACGTKLPEGTLIVPRGATISVRATEAITAAGGEEGAPFRAQLESPLATGTTVFVSSGALVEGIAESTSEGNATQVELRLTRIQISESTGVNIETMPMSRSIASVVAADTVIEATMGLTDKIRYLAELEDNPGDSESAGSELGAIVPSGTQLVFTLAKKIVLVPSS